jgi:tetratricopeptide (TPR) repeat protein
MKVARYQTIKHFIDLLPLLLILSGGCASPKPPNLSTSDQDFTPTVQKGLSYFSARKYEQAVSEFQEAIRAEPNNAFAYYGLGVSYANLKRYKEDVEPLRKSLSLNPHPQWGTINEKMIRDLLAEAEQKAAEAEKTAKFSIFLKERTATEKQRVEAIKAKIPAGKQLATQKFVMKIDRIFSSMEDYYISTIASRSGGGILRKDIDRYDDAVVDAKGDVPDEVIV